MKTAIVGGVGNRKGQDFKPHSQWRWAGGGSTGKIRWKGVRLEWCMDGCVPGEDCKLCGGLCSVESNRYLLN